MKRRIALLLVLLLVSTLLVASAGAWLKYVAFEKLEIQTKENIIALPFVLAADAQLRFSVENRVERLRNPPAETVPTEPVTEETAPPETAAETLPETTEAPTQPPTEPPTEAPTEPPEPVDESWFDDVLFIGESRSKGMQAMGRIGDAEYFCVGAVSIYRILYSEASDYNFPRQTLAGLLSYRDYGKVYIHMGINELGGVFNMEDFLTQYQKIIDHVRKEIPDAYIILQAILPVTSDYSTEPSFRIESIQAVNDAIETLTDGDKILFCDVNEYFVDEDGYLRKDLTPDGCHLTGPGYQEWALRLREHAATLNIPAPEAGE